MSRVASGHREATCAKCGLHRQHVRSSHWRLLVLGKVRTGTIGSWRPVPGHKHDWVLVLKRLAHGKSDYLRCGALAVLKTPFGGGRHLPRRVEKLKLLKREERLGESQ